MHPLVRAAAESAARLVFGRGSGARVLVALSGGPDSCALLLALCEAAEAGLLPRPVGAAHFHHGLRGEDADADAAFSADLATARLHLPCLIGLGAVAPGGRSPNAAARSDRYAFLEAAARELGANVIATAHTADDQAETVLLRALRGTSVDGLAGIPPTRELAPGLLLARPMLSVRRAEVEAYCAERGVSPRRDPSNDKDRYSRGRMRRRLPDLAREFNPRLTDALTRLAAHAAADAALLNRLADALWSRALRRCWPGLSVQLDATELAGADPALRRRALLRAVHAAYDTEDGSDATSREEGATAAFVSLVEGAVLSGAGAHDLPGGVRACVSGGLLTLEMLPTDPVLPPAAYCTALSIPGRTFVAPAHLWLACALEPAAPLPPSADPYTVVFDARACCGTMATDPALAIRPARAGDRIAPLGMNGKTRKVRDVMQEAGWPEPLRARAPLVVRSADDAVLWVVGLVQSEETRVTEQTRSVVRLDARFAC